MGKVAPDGRSVRRWALRRTDSAPCDAGRRSIGGPASAGTSSPDGLRVRVAGAQLLDRVLGRDGVHRQAGPSSSPAISRSRGWISQCQWNVASTCSLSGAVWSTRLYGGPSSGRRGGPGPGGAPRPWRRGRVGPAGEVGVVAARDDPHLERRARGVRREGDRVVVLVEQALGTADLIADVPAPRALPFPDDEARGAAELLGHPMGDLGQVVEVEAEVVRPGAGLGTPVLDDLHVFGAGGLLGVADRSRRRRGALRSSRCRRRGAPGVPGAVRRPCASCRRPAHRRG